MTAYEHNHQLDTIRTTCAMNQRYHQTMEWRYGNLDMVVRIVVGLLAVAGLVTALAGEAGVTPGIWLAVLSLIAAVVLNILLFGDWTKSHGELYRLWSDLRGDADREKLKTTEMADDDEVSEERSDRLEDLTSKMAALNANESAPWKKLLERCHKEARAEMGVD